MWVPARTPTVHWGPKGGRPWVARSTKKQRQCMVWREEFHVNNDSFCVSTRFPPRRTVCPVLSVRLPLPCAPVNFYLDDHLRKPSSRLSTFLLSHQSDHPRFAKKFLHGSGALLARETQHMWSVSATSILSVSTMGTTETPRFSVRSRKCVHDVTVGWGVS